MEKMPESLTSDLLIAEFAAKKARGEIPSNDLLNQRTWKAIKNEIGSGVRPKRAQVYFQMAAALAVISAGWILLVKLQNDPMDAMREKGTSLKDLGDGVTAAPFSFANGQLNFEGEGVKLLLMRPLLGGAWQVVDVSPDQSLVTKQQGEFVACGFAIREGANLPMTVQNLLADPLKIESLGSCAKITL